MSKISDESTVSQSPLNSQLLTVDEIAALIKVSNRTVWRLRSSGQLPEPIRVGGGVRWRQFDINEWITRGCPKMDGIESSQ